MAKQKDALALTMTEAGRLAGLDPRTIRAGVERGTIPALHFGPRVLIPRVAFMRLLETGESGELREAV